jgi:protoheme IX farnesyltransferase
MSAHPDLRTDGLVAATAMGVYLLVMLGVTTEMTAALDACGGQVVCLPATAGWDAVGVVMGHRLLAVAVGIVGAVTAVRVWRASVRLRTRAAVAIAAVVYPLQALAGVGIAAGVSTAVVEAVHLAGGLGIFTLLSMALAWRLEATTAGQHAQATPAPTDEGAGPQTRVGMYISLMKPRLMWLLSLVAAAGMFLASTTGAQVSLTIAVGTLAGGVLAIGAAGTFNHILERDVDRRMRRTADRPLAADAIGVRRATVFGGVLTVAALVSFWAVRPVVALLGAVAIVFYAVIYTLVLKPNTVQNTVLGGAAGALPAVIGWVAVTGDVGLGAVALASVIFLWTPAHFYNLALAYRSDYERGGFPMLSVVRGSTTTRKHILWYLTATFIATVLLAVQTSLGVGFGLAAVAAGGLFLGFVVLLHHRRETRAAIRSFHASNAYLGIVLVSIILETAV